MNNPGQQKVLGVVGGMGPLASAEFLKTVYERSLSDREQDAPIILMYSDPTFPDRTDALLNGTESVVLDQLKATLYRLRNAGATQIVICCITAHHFLPMLPGDLQGSVLSLLDLALGEVARRRKPHLLVCTRGTRQMEIFQSHPRWDEAKEFVILPDEEDQKRIHDELIYAIKGNRNIQELLPFFLSILRKYQVDSFIAGCTEIHMLAKELRACKAAQVGFIDPLSMIADELAGECQ
jgi:aspartate racemase